MIIKKFQGNTETEAIMLAKEELGKDAIVMNMKTIRPRGIFKLFKKSTVEITAAVDDSMNKPLAKKENDRLNLSFATFQKNEEHLLEEQQRLKSELHNAESSELEMKLSNLQSILEKQMNVNKQEIKEKETEKSTIKNKNSEWVELIYNQLSLNEVDEKYTNQIIEEIEPTLKKNTTVDMILASIYQKIILKLGQPKTLEIKKEQIKYVFFIGPTGVGKTTTIAKLASCLKMECKGNIALVTSDTYRIAAVDQLRTYANILDIPLKVIYSENELTEIMEDYNGFDVVLIDTAGRSHKSIEQRDDIERLIESIPKEQREVYLVLSATTKYQDLIKITEAYSEISDYRLIFTKLDETGCIGNIFNIKMLTGASLSYVTFGQNVPDDITKINAQNIAKQLLGGNV